MPNSSERERGASVLPATPVARTPNRREEVVEVVAVALVGCGARGLEIGKALRESTRLRLLGVCDLDERRLGEASRVLEVPGESDYRRFLDRRDVPAVYIAT